MCKLGSLPLVRAWGLDTHTHTVSLSLRCWTDKRKSHKHSHITRLKHKSSSIVESSVNSSFVVFIPDQKTFQWGHRKTCIAGDVSVPWQQVVAPTSALRRGETFQKCPRKGKTKVKLGALCLVAFSSSHLRTVLSYSGRDDHLPLLPPPHISHSSSSSSSAILSAWTKLLLFFWCRFSQSLLQLDSGHLPLLLLPAYLGVVFLVCSWKGPQSRDNRAPARIMSPQRAMQLGPRVIQERRWWPRFKVVRDDPQPHLPSPWLEFPLWHTLTKQSSTDTRCSHSHGNAWDKYFFFFNKYIFSLWHILTCLSE